MDVIIAVGTQHNTAAAASLCLAYITLRALVSQLTTWRSFLTGGVGLKLYTFTIDKGRAL